MLAAQRRNLQRTQTTRVLPSSPPPPPPTPPPTPTPPHLFAAAHHPQHVGLHDGGQVVVVALQQGAVLVRVGSRVVDPWGGGSRLGLVGFVIPVAEEKLE